MPVKNLLYVKFIRTNKRLAAILTGAVVLLLLPLTAMFFTGEVNWTFFDFMAAAVLLLSAGLILEFILRKAWRSSHKIVASVILLVVFLLVWAELAVGIFGTPFAGR